VAELIEPDEFAGGGRRQGPDAVAAYLRDSLMAWRELHSERIATVHGSDIVITHHVRGVLADGTPHEATVADVYTVRGGQVVRMHAYADPQAPFRSDARDQL